MRQVPLIIIGGIVFLFSVFSFYPSEKQAIIALRDSPIPEDYSSDPPAAKTGAPGESTCTFCHTGSVLSAIGVVNFDFGNFDTAQYQPNQIYDLSISVASGSKNGFQMTILDNNNQKAGSFINGANTSTVTAQGKEYIRHTNSVGITSWQFQWQAPATDQGNLMAFYAFNKSNANQANTGDKIYIGSELIYSAMAVDLVESQNDQHDVFVKWDPFSKQLILNYTLITPSKVMVTVQTLTGQLVQSTSLGIQNEGQYHQLVDGQNIAKGVYVISVFFNNRVINYKLGLN